MPHVIFIQSLLQAFLKQLGVCDSLLNFRGPTKFIQN